MKGTLTALTLILCTPFLAAAQDAGMNGCAGNITGIYYVSHAGENSKVRVYQDTDGTFTARTIWVENRLDKNGNVRLDEKNPDKALRSTPCDSITVIEGLKYNPDKKRWDSGKIYDPTRGLRANVTCSFDSDTSLKVRGTLMGFGETIFWKKIGE